MMGRRSQRHIQTGSVRRAAIAITAMALMIISMSGFAAQNLGLGTKGDKPIQIYADNGIEWNQNTHQYIARGNAKAIQGTTTVYGDTLVAYYEEVAGGNTEVYRLDALGRVRIVSPTETAYGDKGVYDVRKGVLVMTGKNLKLVTQSEIITARDSLEYYETKSLAVARGNAVSTPIPATGKGAKDQSGDQGRTVRADILTGHFVDDAPNGPGAAKGSKSQNTGPQNPDPQGTKRGSTLDRMDAWGNVVVTRPGEVALGSRGVYFPKTGIANLWGKVRITRADNQLNGEYAEVNFNTGISHILSSPSGPVQALIEPEKTPKNPSPSDKPYTKKQELGR
ncbi:MAG: lipopolysaccharide export system protein LptA [Alphaproteobacteria bacterium]|jgi:lipopolysaccharide export system protein LptA